MSGGSDSAWRPAAPTASPAEQIEGYDGLVEIGRGGDSVVYRAREVRLGREVAIKVQLVDDPARRARFEREVAITVDLGRQHPNIVTVLATGQTASGRPCIVMDYCPAGTLQDRLKAHGPLPVDEVVAIGVVLADALAFAHERGVLHRDVKPQNVLVLPTSWVLADFGIARLADSEHTSSAETFTYRHASPQILDGYPPTAADDIWSLGSTLFTLIDGRPPFASDDPDEDSALAYLRRARTEPHRRLTTPGTERVAAIIDRCLAKSVDERWATAAEVRDALAGMRSTAWQPGSAADAEPAAHHAAPVPVAPVTPEEARWAPDDTRRRRELEAALAAQPQTSADPARAAASRAAAVQGGPPIIDASSIPGLAPSPESLTGPAAPPAVPAAAARGLSTPEEPVALSVLAHSPAAADSDPTGSVRDLEWPPSAGTPAPVVSAPGRSRRRVLLSLGAVALAVGSLLGIGGTILRNRGDDKPTVTTTPQGQPIRSLTAAPTQSGDPQVAKPDDQLRFIITEVRFNGSGFDISWTDPTDGQVQLFYLQKTKPKSPEIRLSFPGTVTSTAIPMLVENGRYCFAMTLITTTGDIGVAKTQCRTIRG